MLIAIKIGENESNSYKKYDEISHDYDVVEAYHKKGNGQIITSLGAKGDKYYLLLNVNTNHFSDKQHINLRKQLVASEMNYEEKKIKYKRLWKFNPDFIFSSETKEKIQQQAGIKKAIKLTIYQYMKDNNLIIGEKLLKKSFDIDYELERIKNIGKFTFTSSEELINEIKGNYSINQFRKELHYNKNRLFKKKISKKKEAIKTHLHNYFKTKDGKICAIDLLTRDLLAKKKKKLEIVFDMSPINDYSKIVSWDLFCDSLINKKTGEIF